MVLLLLDADVMLYGVVATLAETPMALDNGGTVACGEGREGESDGYCDTAT
jgi:hypothetical protein